ncbi:DUF4159 domain-containing protein [Paradonghicola geojensis]|nr:DUF4159 domain-containing protein [Marivivens geojensis]
MFQLGPIGFAAPWLLIALVALPILWILLRAVPPAPIRRRFPGVALLLGLSDNEVQTDRTPWWLLLLRSLAVAAMIIGFAGPVLNPQQTDSGAGPLLIVTDGSWASARDWATRLDRIDAMVATAGRQGRTVAVVSLTDLPADGIAFQSADAVGRTVAGLTPNPWEPSMNDLTAWIAGLEGSFDTNWLSDGLGRDTRADLVTAFQSHGDLRVFETARPVYALSPAEFADGKVTLTALRSLSGVEVELSVAAIGLDPSGIERQLATQPVTFATEAVEASVTFDLPPELRNRVTRFELIGQSTAGAVTLTDDSLKRREVALISGGASREGLELLSPLHYLREALAENADLLELPLGDVIPANPDVIILADVATLSPLESEAITAWVENGGLLVRFAGPRMAAADLSQLEEDPLMPVRLRSGGRSVGGTMSWGAPKTLDTFAATSPFAGLTVPDDVEVTSQVVAQPDPTLAERVIAQLTDGTPLVTRAELGAGQIVLFHVTANAEWSNLPLSGLFVQMLERLAVSTRPSQPTLDDLAGTTWMPERVLNATGTLRDAETLAGVSGERIAEGTVGADLHPGLYSGEDRALAVNVLTQDSTLTPATWPAGITVEGTRDATTTPLKGALLFAALLVLMADIIASLSLSGRLRGARAMLLGLIALGLMPRDGMAQDDSFAIAATSDVVLAYVITGDQAIDDISYAGLYGLSDTLYRRTSIEPANPIGVNIEMDELSFFPLLYWPITPNQPMPSREAYAKLNRYLRSGGMILFDTRDGDVAQYGTSTPEARKLQAIAAGLDIPPIEPIPEDHVLTRTFYLLQDFPGRYNSPEVWVEASPPDAEQIDGMPFRNLNDGVTPVVIGGNDWASAWAMDEAGRRLLPVGRGMAGERQREIAYRFGVNLVMHVLTGNYKSDQVHVPALLDRLGQ